MAFYSVLTLAAAELNAARTCSASLDHGALQLEIVKACICCLL